MNNNNMNQVNQVNGNNNAPAQGYHANAPIQDQQPAPNQVPNQAPIPGAPMNGPPPYGYAPLTPGNLQYNQQYYHGYYPQAPPPQGYYPYAPMYHPQRLQIQAPRQDDMCSSRRSGGAISVSSRISTMKRITCPICPVGSKAYQKAHTYMAHLLDQHGEEEEVEEILRFAFTKLPPPGWTSAPRISSRASNHGGNVAPVPTSRRGNGTPMSMTPIREEQEADFNHWN